MGKLSEKEMMLKIADANTIADIKRDVYDAVHLLNDGAKTIEEVERRLAYVINRLTVFEGSVLNEINSPN